MRTIMDTIEQILKLGDEYKEKTSRNRGISDYIWDNLPDKEKYTKRYILVLLHYGRKLKSADVWEKAKEEQWDNDRIRDFITTSKK